MVSATLLNSLETNAVVSWSGSKSLFFPVEDALEGLSSLIVVLKPGKTLGIEAGYVIVLEMVIEFVELVEHAAF